MLPTIPGQPVTGPYLTELRINTSRLFGLEVNDRREPRFPGAQPVSFNKSHLDVLTEENFFVSEKADGIRCLLVAYRTRHGQYETFLVDRKNNYYKINLPLPKPDDIHSFQSDTVLDGELVLDIKDGQEILWFLLFDCMISMGVSLLDKPFHKRLGRLKEHVVKPFKQKYREDKRYAESIPFRFDVKPLELAYHVQKVFETIPKLHHKNDGVIFTSSVAPYTIGTCQKMLKWKPSEENTVDFKLDGPDRDGRYWLSLWTGRDGHSHFGEFTPEEELRREWEYNPPGHGKIIECRYDPSWPGMWRFSRFRDDKENANHENVYRSIMDSIRDNVEQEEIVNHAPIIREHWKQPQKIQKIVENKKQKNKKTMADSVFLKLTPKVNDLYKKLRDFVDFECIPAEKVYHHQMAPFGHADRWKIVPPIIETLKTRARQLGLWNAFLPPVYGEYSPGFTNLEYAVLCELMGRSFLAPEACNCAAPDTGNMEVFAKYGTKAQKDKWLVPLLEGKIRSAFAMTEPRVASADATNIETQIVRDERNNQYVINGKKWWISGAGDPRCKVYLLMGKTDSGAKKHLQQSVVIVPADAPGIQIVRPMMVFGYDDAPHGHCEIIFKDVRIPFENVILGEGRGFEVVQGRLGPGRIHHCMRSIGLAERALDHHILRITDPTRKTFGKLIAEHNPNPVAESRMEIDQARLLVLKAADTIDKFGAKAALKEIGMAKIIVPQMALRVIDRSIQAHGGGGVSQDFPMAYMYAQMRTLRIADGPDEVHMKQVSLYELKRSLDLRDRHSKQAEAEVKLLAKL